jgi:hypothetical protein
MDVLVNTKDYTILELILFGVGCYMWVVAYGIYIVNIRRGRCLDMAIFGACGNLAWETVWSWHMPSTDMGLVMLWAYRFWFLFDLYIFWGIMQYGYKQMTTPALRTAFKPMMIITTFFCTALFLAFKVQGYDTPIGANSAFILQDFDSILCLMLLLRKPPGVYFSNAVGWWRSIGTGTNVVFMFLHYPHNYFLQILAASALIVDSTYLTISVLRTRKNKNWALENLNAPDPLEGPKEPIGQAILATS